MGKDRLMIWVRVLFSLIATFNGVKSRILTASDTIDVVLSGKSLIRFGDGEFGIYRNRDIHYQKWSEELKSAFEDIKKRVEIEKENCPYLLAVPKKYMQCNGFVLCKRRVLVSSWAESRLQFKKKFSNAIVYGDAFVFEKKNKELYKRLWKEATPNNIIFVHNSQQYAEAFQRTCDKNVHFVQCPAQNAFESLEQLRSDINSIIKEHNLTRANTQLVLSAGPAGKVLAFLYSDQGYQCIDAGHCWDDPLESY